MEKYILKKYCKVLNYFFKSILLDFKYEVYLKDINYFKFLFV